MKLRSLIERLVLYCSIALFTVMIAGVLIQITVRNFFGFSINFLEELSMLLLSWFAFLTMAYTLSRHNHVLVDLFIRKLPARAALIWDMLIKTAVIAVLAATALSCLGLISRQMAIPMSLLPFQRGVLYFGLPTGCGLMIYFLCDDIRQEFMDFKSKGGVGL